MYNQTDICIATSFPHPHPGGVSTHLDLLYAGLLRRDYMVRIVTSSDALPSKLERGANKVCRRLARRSYLEWLVAKSVRRLGAAIVSRRPRIVHAHDYIAALAADAARRECGSVIVATVHGPASRHAVEMGNDPCSYDVKYIETCERRAWSGCDAIIAVDSGQRAIVLEQGAAREKVSVILNAIDVGEIDAVKGPSPNYSRPYYVVPRRLAPKNGVEFAIRAMEYTRDRKAELLIVGNGPLRAELEALATELGISSRVRFLGSLPRPAVLNLMWNAAAVLIPSINIAGFAEASSLAALEGMAAGKPVVASAVGGLRELIRDGTDGYLVPERDPKAIAEALDGILEQPTRAAEVAMAARATIENQFSCTSWLDRVIGTYESAMSVNALHWSAE